MTDIVRAFRLIANAGLYIEVGTYDKGNLAYAASVLAPTAELIDVDIRARPDRQAQLLQRLAAGQVLHTIIGDSSADDTTQQVASILGGRRADAVFIDADHSADAVLADYASYAPLVREGGFILFHDVYWQGDSTTLGTAAAMEQIDRLSPVWVICMDHPIHRFLPWMSKQTVAWGGVGVIRRS